MEKAFTSLYPDIFEDASLRLVCPPPNTSQNATIFKGVPHCLNYGYDKKTVKRKKRERSKVVISDDEDSDDPVLVNSSSTDDEECDANRVRGDQGRVNRARGRVEKRILLSKTKQDNQKRSGSRSDSSEDEVDLGDNVINIQNPQRPAQWHQLDYIVANHDQFYLQSKAYFKYFEPYSPDVVCHKVIEKKKVIVKFVCEIASWHKEGRNDVLLKTLVNVSTEQCVQSGLAALAHDQKYILGIVVVPDGLKVCQIKKRRNHYKISETCCVSWEEDQKLFALLEMIRKALVS